MNSEHLQLPHPLRLGMGFDGELFVAQNAALMLER